MLLNTLLPCGGMHILPKYKASRHLTENDTTRVHSWSGKEQLSS
jgi:hypothetical protein